MSRLVLVSNRVALPGEERAGGLAVALARALEETGGLWFGWSGTLAESDDEARREHWQRAGETTFLTLALRRQEHAGFYTGFANRVLWPLLHYRTDLMEYRRQDRDTYFAVNRRFAAALSRHLRPDDLVWVHDYHFLPFGAELRRLGYDRPLGLFLHTPCPPRALLELIPAHQELFTSLTAYDLIGLQTETDAEALDHYLVRHGSRDRSTPRPAIAAFPIGIDPEGISRLAQRSIQTASVRRLHTSLEGRRLILGVDRLDYSKGLPRRFEAFALALEADPTLARTVSYLQIAPASRGDVPEYREIRRELERLAGHINGRHAEPDWTPIRYVNRTYSHPTLCGYYRLARVGLVTPLRDGMNLVAKEYLAAQDPSDPGILILSEFTGAAHELTSALLVNPYDLDAMADAIRHALGMPLAERRGRWQAAMDRLRTQTVTTWYRTFLRDLVRHHEESAHQP